MNKSSSLVYGLRAVLETIKSGQHLERIFLQKNLKGDVVKELMYEIHRSGTPLSKVPVERLHKLTKKNHQGVVALSSPIQYHTIEYLVPEIYEKGESPFFLILDEITDVRNFGAIARSAECFGVHGMIIPIKGSAQINEDAIKTSVGALNYLPVCRTMQLVSTVEFLQSSGIKVVACSEKGSKTIKEVDYQGPIAIVMGSEEHGISNEVMNLADEIVQIPMTGEVASLNVSTASGIILYEATRQRS
ncbi:MAG: 23S rRNA (guanosine(2251)-2'-O)-methyltransferase RlmB [Bacteroidota bacterium]